MPGLGRTKWIMKRYLTILLSDIADSIQETVGLLFDFLHHLGFWAWKIIGIIPLLILYVIVWILSKIYGTLLFKGVFVFVIVPLMKFFYLILKTIRLCIRL